MLEILLLLQRKLEDGWRGHNYYKTKRELNVCDCFRGFRFQIGWVAIIQLLLLQFGFNCDNA